MRRKISTESKLLPELVIENEIFLETSEADLVSRWSKEIRALTRKDRHSCGGKSALTAGKP